MSGRQLLGLLPATRVPGVWNPWLPDGLADAPQRAQLRAEAELLGLQPYWLTYANSYYGLTAVEQAHGTLPNYSGPRAPSLIDDTSTGLGVCTRPFPTACGCIVSQPNGLAGAAAAWWSGDPMLWQRNAGTARDAGGLWPDDWAPMPVEALQIDLEGGCTQQLLNSTWDAARAPHALTVLSRAFEVVRDALDAGTLGGGTSRTTRVGYYGFPSGRGRCNTAGLDGVVPWTGSPSFGYWSDFCGLVDAANPFPAGALNASNVGSAYSPLSSMLPWLYFTGEPPQSHPAFPSLSSTDAAQAVAWAASSTRRAPFFDFYFRAADFTASHRASFALGPATWDALVDAASLPAIDRELERLPGELLFPSLYSPAGKVAVASGDPSDNPWNRSRSGVGAAIFNNQVGGFSSPQVAATFDHLLALELEDARLGNHLRLELAWAWKLVKGRKIVPIITPTPVVAARHRVVRQPANGGVTLCTEDLAAPGQDPGLPDRCGPLPVACSIAGEGPLVARGDFPVHPGRTAVLRTWDDASSGFVERPTDAEARTWVAAGTEIFVHQSLAEFRTTQVLPLVQAIPRGELDGVSDWPEPNAMARLCTSQAFRLKRGGGFTGATLWGPPPYGGVPEPSWTLFFVPGPLTELCQAPGNTVPCRQAFAPSSACVPGAQCEPTWSSLTDSQAEAACSLALDRYWLARWATVKQTLDAARAAQPPPELRWRPSAWCSYLEQRFSARYSQSLSLCSGH